MFKEKFKEKGIRTVIFLVAYTILFFLFFKTLKYTLPFVLGFIISLLVKPLSKYLRKKLPFSRKVSSALSALISTLLVFSILVSIVSFSLYKIIDELRQFIVSLPDLDTMLISIESFTGDLSQYFPVFDSSEFDLDFVQRIYNQLSSFASGLLDVTKFIANKLVSVVTSLPFIIAVGLITFLSTYFFSKDLPNIERRLLSIFTSDGRVKARRILRESKSMLGNYLKSYLYLIALTFTETLIGFTILGINYSIILSLITAVVDILPVFGVGSMYLPIAIYFYFKGKTSVTIGLIIMFVLVSVVRQIAEPKLVSTNVGIHPLLVIAALFIGLKSFGILGILYFISIILFYKIFQKVEIL